MINRLLPRRLDNTYHGHGLALWVFALVVFAKFLQVLVVMLSGPAIAQSADGIPLDTYVPAAAQTVVGLFALLGLSRLIMSLFCTLVLVRYRGAIPLMFALLGFDYLARQLMLHFVPIARTGSAPGPVVNVVLFVLTIVGFGLSLWCRDKLPSQ